MISHTREINTNSHDHFCSPCRVTNDSGIMSCTSTEKPDKKCRYLEIRNFDFSITQFADCSIRVYKFFCNACSKCSIKQILGRDCLYPWHCYYYSIVAGGHFNFGIAFF